jgi:ketosteroid isomerase-like protein
LTATGADRPDGQDVVAHDLRLEAAISGGDFRTLDELLAADFVYTHSTGVRQPRAVYLAAEADRTVRSQRELTDIEVELHGDLAISSGDLTITYSRTRGRPPHLLRYLRVHRRQPGGPWQTLSHRTLART